MKQILILVCIGLFAVFCAGCTANDAGTTIAGNQSAVAVQGNGMPANVTEQHMPPPGEMNATAGSTGPLPPGFQGNSTDDRPEPPDGINGTPGAMGPGSLQPGGKAPPDRPEMIQIGIPRQGSTSA